MKNTPEEINSMYEVLVEGVALHIIDPDLYTEADDDPLLIMSPDYINRLGTEYGEKVIYWEENYNPSAYRMGENDGEKEKRIIEVLEEYGIEFDEDLVKKYPLDHKENENANN